MTVDLRSDFCAPPTDEMWTAMGEAELGWGDTGPPHRFIVGAAGQASRIATSFATIRKLRRKLRLRGLVYYTWRDARPYPPGSKPPLANPTRAADGCDPLAPVRFLPFAVSYRSVGIQTNLMESPSVFFPIGRGERSGLRLPCLFLSVSRSPSRPYVLKGTRRMHPCFAPPPG